MTVQVQKKQLRARRRSAQESGDTQIIVAHRDADVVQMATAMAEARAAECQVKVATAAYFLAEKRGFEPGHELDDWLAAEAEVAGLRVSLDSPVLSIESGSVS